MLHQQEGAVWTWVTDKAQAVGGHLPTFLPGCLRLSELGFAGLWNIENGNEKGEQLVWVLPRPLVS